MVSWAVLPSAGLLQSYIIISRKNNARPHRLVWPRTQAFQACDWGSNPHGDVLFNMCGIIGYVGKKDCLPVLLEGLKRLEYRGYDSSGVGIISANKKLLIRKRPGKIKDLIKNLEDAPLSGSSSCGISHTRWATHGVPNQTNAHPHTDCKG